MNGFPVEKDTYVGAEGKTRRELQYDMFHHIWESARAQDRRVAKLERAKWWNTAASAVGGVFGGIIAVMGKWFFFK